MMGKLNAQGVIKVIRETTGVPRLDNGTPERFGGHHYYTEDNGELYDSSLDRVYRYLDQGNGFMMVTAYRLERSQQSNQKVHSELKKLVREHGHILSSCRKTTNSFFSPSGFCVASNPR
jgi:hypothetical protein